VALPAAIAFTFWILASWIITQQTQATVLTLLLLTLVLPGFLSIISTNKPGYIIWLFPYLLALPIWNFVFPIYSFWHFDDFSWGDTRKVQGEGIQHDHSARKGEYEIGSVPIKR
jgi:chitin synthase